jgi:hypothetical protein
MKIRMVAGCSYGNSSLNFETCSCVEGCGHRYPVDASETKSLLPSDAKERKNIPIATGVLDYFPAALIEVAKVSKTGNDQHNPGEPLHWARGKSTDQEDTIIRHFLERGKTDTDGVKHSAKLAWRVLAMLQLECEAEGAPLARGARLPEKLEQPIYVRPK